MKALYFILVLVALILPEKTISQNQSTTSLLIGTWTFDFDESLKKMNASTRVFYDAIDQTQRSSIQNVYRDRKVTFDNDGSYLQVLSDGRTSTGTWMFIKKGKSIQIKDPQGNIYTQKLKILTETQLVLKPEEFGSNKMLISEWHFIKTKI